MKIRFYLLPIFTYFASSAVFAQVVGPETGQQNLPFSTSQILVDQNQKISINQKQSSDLNQAIVMADFDNDGIDDYAKSSLNPNQLGLWLFLSSQKNTQFIKTQSAVYSRNLIAKDINNDGVIDLVYPSKYKLAVKLGNGNGTFQKSIVSGFASPLTQHLLTHDLNGDGNVDIVMIINSHHQENAYSKIAIEYGDGTGSFSVKQQLEMDTNISTATLFNDDSDLVLAVGGSRARHSGVSGLFVASFKNGLLQTTKQVASFVPSALAKNAGQLGLYGSTNNSVFYYANNQLVTQKILLDNNKNQPSRVDVAVNPMGDGSKLHLVLLEVASSSQIRFFEIIK